MTSCQDAYRIRGCVYQLRPDAICFTDILLSDLTLKLREDLWSSGELVDEPRNRDSHGILRAFEILTGLQR